MVEPIKNKLPKGFKSWYCLYLYLEKRGLISADNKPNTAHENLLPTFDEGDKWNDEKKWTNLERFELDFDYIKARAFEEIAHQQFDFDEFKYIRLCVNYAQNYMPSDKILNRLNEMLFEKSKLDSNFRNIPI